MSQNLLNGIFTSLASGNQGTKSQNLETQARLSLTLARDYVRSYYQAQQNAGLFKDVRTYCTFVGHARSGGSLIGGLLDAHPNVIMADEVDIFPYVAAGFKREQIFNILLNRSQIQSRKGRKKDGRDSKTYSYMVPDQWQGRFEKLLVIGNRKAGISTQQIRRDPGLLPRFRQMLTGEIDLITILTIRNPFDTISTMSIRSGRTLTNGMDHYFDNCKTIDQLKTSLSSDSFLMMKHEDFIADPTNHLLEACRFLEISAPADYIDACVSIMYKTPAKSRAKVTWTPDLINAVNNRIEQFEFLQGYSFTS